MTKPHLSAAAVIATAPPLPPPLLLAQPPPLLLAAPPPPRQVPPPPLLVPPPPLLVVPPPPLLAVPPPLLLVARLGRLGRCRGCRSEGPSVGVRVGLGMAVDVEVGVARPPPAATTGYRPHSPGQRSLLVTIARFAPQTTFVLFTRSDCGINIRVRQSGLSGYGHGT